MSSPLSSPARAFVGTIEATPVTGKYKFGLALTAFGMVQLMAAYFGLILLIGYAIYYDVAHFSRILEVADKSHSFFAPFGCIAAPVCGVVVAFFMVKPFLAGKPPEPDRYTLSRESDPELFAVIAKICELVKAPLPSRVDVDCQVNASVRFRKGWQSLNENDVVLTIGLPLVANLTMQEFVGVLAHEFGHFTQGAGMRVTYITRAINRWFARVVYERDQWDIWLARIAQGIDIRIGIFLHLTRLCIWLSRRVLWVMMHVGCIISGFMLRQMELDADSYETKVAGSAAFAETMAKIQKLNAASLWAHGKMKESWRSRRLPEDVVSFIGASIKKIPPELQKKIDEAAAKKKTGLFDTHPCDVARVQASAAMNQPGVFHSAEPAARLFNGFEALCKGATRFHYASTLELRVKDENLVPLEKSERESQSIAEGEAALRQFFGGLKFRYRPMLISNDGLASAGVVDLMQQITLARRAMEESTPLAVKANREYGEAEGLYQRGLNALKSESQTATEKANAAMEKVVPTLAAYEGYAQTRLLGALLLLQHPEIAKKLPEIEALRSEADQLTVVFKAIGEIFPSLQELRRKNEALIAALRACREHSLAAGGQARVAELEPELREMLAGLKPLLERVRYPYHLTREDVTLAEFARADIPAIKVDALCNKCACHVNGLLSLYTRVLGRLAFISLKVEEKITATPAI